jgi:hypothetical protein
VCCLINESHVYVRDTSTAPQTYIHMKAVSSVHILLLPCELRDLIYNELTGINSVASQGYLSWNQPGTSWPNLQPRSTTFTFAHSTSCTYVYLMYIYLLVYSLGQSTQFSYTVVNALSAAIVTVWDSPQNMVQLLLTCFTSERAIQASRPPY